MFGPLLLTHPETALGSCNVLAARANRAINGKISTTNRAVSNAFRIPPRRFVILAVAMTSTAQVLLVELSKLLLWVCLCGKARLCCYDYPIRLVSLFVSLVMSHTLMTARTARAVLLFKTSNAYFTPIAAIVFSSSSLLAFVELAVTPTGHCSFLRNSPRL